MFIVCRRSAVLFSTVVSGNSLGSLVHCFLRTDRLTEIMSQHSDAGEHGVPVFLTVISVA